MEVSEGTLNYNVVNYGFMRYQGVVNSDLILTELSWKSTFLYVDPKLDQKTPSWRQL